MSLGLLLLPWTANQFHDVVGACFPTGVAYGKLAKLARRRCNLMDSRILVEKGLPCEKAGEARCRRDRS